MVYFPSIMIISWGMKIRKLVIAMKQVWKTNIRSAGDSLPSPTSFEPSETLHKHRHHDELRDAVAHAPDGDEFSSFVVSTRQSGRHGYEFGYLGVESFNGCNSANCAIDKSCRNSRLLTLSCKKRRGECLREHRGESDRGERGRAEHQASRYGG
jgi:hypothetical protein